MQNLNTVKVLALLNKIPYTPLYNSGAYYTVKTHHGIRIMALNTNLYYRSDKVSQKYRYSDPADQFQWMTDTLQHAKDRKEKVNVIFFNILT